MKKFLVFLCGVVLVLGIAANSAFGAYYIWDDWGGTYHDADKTIANTDDDLLCWAAGASNILDWAGWEGYVGDQDAIFGHFQNHFEDKGNLPRYGWEWYFDGTYDGPTAANWAQPDVAGGGGFYPTENFLDYYVEDYKYDAQNKSSTLSSIDAYLHDGYGVTLGIYKGEWDEGGSGHAITVWGFDTVDDEYTSLWITDSDDYAGYDVLTEVSLGLVDNMWYLTDYSDGNYWIGIVSGLEQASVPVPEPATMLLIGSGLIGLAGLGRKKLFKRS